MSAMSSPAASDSPQQPAHDETAHDEPTPIETLSFEEARDELAEVVQSLEQGSLTLEESLRLWERGEALAERCEQWLRGARERLERARPADDANSDDSDEDASTDPDR